ncbi:hypothetical protein Zmor_014906 [Zophobas morio]|uniref:Uncharacterized protein n=1 Tax=Zophobas morio TaxID=2755281 RepID=A0AA38MH36_9CUCU|nr:hypothetical protein Zmor_014906 [Zophobas morio]
MDETGFHINYEAGAVILTKGSKDVHTIISSERGENVSIITCCSVEGRFIPPVIIFKGGEVTVVLNQCPNGSKKEWEQWRKVWQDLKKNAKAKAASISSNFRKTGSGPGSEETMDQLESSIIDLMAPTEIHGDMGVSESQVSFEGISVVGDTDAASSFTINDHKNDNVEASTSTISSIPVKNLKAVTKTRRLNKTHRLKTSLQASERLLSISEKKEQYLQRYYQEKIAISKQAEERHRNYKNKKLLLLEQQVHVQQSLLGKLRQLKTAILSTR